MKKYKLFGKIPIFDIIIVLIVAVAVVIVGKVFMSSKTGQTVSNSKVSTIRYTVELQNISDMVDGVPDAGEKVRDVETSTDMGIVVSAQSKTYSVTMPNMVTGEAVTSVQNDRQNIEIIIEASATVSDTGISVNGIRFGVGRTVGLSMTSLSGNAIVRNIEILEA